MTCSDGGVFSACLFSRSLRQLYLSDIQQEILKKVCILLQDLVSLRHKTLQIMLEKLALC